MGGGLLALSLADTPGSASQRFFPVQPPVSAPPQGLHLRLGARLPFPAAGGTLVVMGLSVCLGLVSASYSSFKLCLWV